MTFNDFDDYDFFYNSPDDNVSLSDAFKQEISEIQKEYSNITKDDLCIPTGFENIDNIIKGLHNSELILLASRPHMGKTCLAIDIAQNISIRQGKSVVFFSFNNTKRNIIRYIMRSESKVFLERISNYEYYEWNKLYLACNNIMEQNPRLFINDSSGICIEDLEDNCSYLNDTERLDLIIIDEIQLMSTKKNVKDNKEELYYITKKLKQLAIKFDVPIILLSALPKEVDNRNHNNPRLSDLKEYGLGSLIQIPDIIMCLYRPSFYNFEYRDYPTELNIMKNKYGNTGLATVSIGNTLG